MARRPRRSRARDDEPFVTVWSRENRCYVAYLVEWRTTVDGETLEEARLKARGLLGILRGRTGPDDGAGDRLIAQLRPGGKGIDFRCPDDSKADARSRALISKALLAYIEDRAAPARKRTSAPARAKRRKASSPAHR